METIEKRSKFSQEKIMKNCKKENYSNNPENYLHKYLLRQSTVKELPIFWGDPMDWPIFINQFRETSELYGFLNRESMSRLQKSIARYGVQYLLNFPEQLEKVIAVLERRFGRPEHVIEEIIEKIKRMPFLKEYQLEELIDFANKVLNLVATIESMNCSGYLMNSQVLNDLVNKLPPNLKLQWGSHRSKCGNLADLKLFAIWIEDIADNASFVSKPKLHFEKRMNFHKQNETNMMTTVDRKLECIYCKNKKFMHPITKCKKFTSIPVDERWEWAKMSKICFACLKQNHQIQFCKFKRECKKKGCTKFHHPLLHSNHEQSQPSLEPKQTSSHEGSEENNVVKSFNATV